MSDLSPEYFTYPLYEVNWSERLGIDYMADDLSDEVVRKIGNCAIGWCDGSRLSVRPKSDMMAVMCQDEDGDYFWFHVRKETIEKIMEKTK